MSVSVSLSWWTRRLTVLGSDRVQLLYRNAKQMKRIVEAAYTDFSFEDRVVSSQELGFNCLSPGVSLEAYGE